VRTGPPLVDQLHGGTDPDRADLSPLLALLTLDNSGDVFRPTYYPESSVPFVFGGQLLAQSLRAAASTVTDDRRPHSMHGHFFAAGRPDRPLVYTVERVRDGGSFSARRVHVEQDGSHIFTATASFNQVRDGADEADYQVPAPRPTPRPEDSEYPWASVMGGWGVFAAFETRELHPAEPAPDGTRAFSRRFWVRTAGRLPEDPALHACVLAFVSDFGVTMAASVTAGLYGRATVLSSLDHGLWFHRPVRADAWALIDMVSVSNSSSCGFVRGTVHDGDGVLLASLAQEALIR